LKSSGWQTLFEAIRTGIKGNPFVDQKLQPLMRQKPAFANVDFDDVETDIVTRLAMSNSEIADELGRDEADVETMLNIVAKKLGVATQAEALIRAAEEGYIGLPLAMSAEKQQLAEKLAREAIERGKTS
jgi:DNA-binding NarL/FixJ family response regulator